MSTDGQSFQPYSCLVSVYKSEKAPFLRISLESILKQTAPPSEIVVVKDGKLTFELEGVLEELSQENPGLFKFIAFEENRGLWKALQEGVASCSHDLIMRMDSDDYAMPERAERQLAYMEAHPECACCGCYVDEFKGSLDNVVSHVVLPVDHESIASFAQRRNPLRHPAMLYRKSAVLGAGNYREMPYFEDYDLVLRLIDGGNSLHNLPEALVRMRVNPDFYRRRGTATYLKYMNSFRLSSMKAGFIKPLNYAIAVIPHAVVCLLPNKAREAIYKKILRK